MLSLIAIAIAALVFGGFLLLTAFETKRGERVLAPLRARLDVYASGAARLVRKADLHALPYTKLRTAFMHVVHEVAHGVLVGVRALERALTRTVRTLRHTKDGTTPPADSVEKVG